jgi:hypothetical protein
MRMITDIIIFYDDKNAEIVYQSPNSPLRQELDDNPEAEGIILNKVIQGYDDFLESKISSSKKLNDEEKPIKKNESKRGRK